jgi:hypothetical protein
MLVVETIAGGAAQEPSRFSNGKRLSHLLLNLCHL